MQANPAVLALLRGDEWTVVEGKASTNPYVLRYRTPVLGPSQVGEFTRLLRCVWAYAPPESGAMPSQAESAAMSVFEQRLCTAWESDGAALLTAVLTFDGARQWVFYTPNAAECGRRLNAMPQEAEPYPIELDASDDPSWSYLREQVIGSRGPEV